MEGLLLWQFMWIGSRPDCSAERVGERSSYGLHDATSDAPSAHHVGPLCAAVPNLGIVDSFDTRAPMVVAEHEGVVAEDADAALVPAAAHDHGAASRRGGVALAAQHRGRAVADRAL